MRLATATEFSTTPRDVALWSFRDQLESHMTLDALEAVKDLYRPDPPKHRNH